MLIAIIVVWSLVQVWLVMVTRVAGDGEYIVACYIRKIGWLSGDYGVDNGADVIFYRLLVW